MTKRRPGRPPLDVREPSVPVCLKVSGPQYNDLTERAKRERVSVSELIRRDLAAAAEQFRNSK